MRAQAIRARRSASCAARISRCTSPSRATSRGYPPSNIEMDRKLFCKEAGRFSRLRQYRLERKSIDIELRKDRRTADGQGGIRRNNAVLRAGHHAGDARRFPRVADRRNATSRSSASKSGDLVFLSTEERIILVSRTLDIRYD